MAFLVLFLAYLSWHLCDLVATNEVKCDLLSTIVRCLTDDLVMVLDFFNHNLISNLVSSIGSSAAVCCS